MHVLADIQLVPFTGGVSLSPYVAECSRILEEAGLKTSLHAFGTNVEGDWEDVMAALKQCHERLHEMGAPRVTASVKLATRTDRAQSLADRVTSVEEKR